MIVMKKSIWLHVFVLETCRLRKFPQKLKV